MCAHETSLLYDHTRPRHGAGQYGWEYGTSGEPLTGPGGAEVRRWTKPMTRTGKHTPNAKQTKRGSLDMVGTVDNIEEALRVWHCARVTGGEEETDRRWEMGELGAKQRSASLRRGWRKEEKCRPVVVAPEA